MADASLRSFYSRLTAAQKQEWRRNFFVVAPFRFQPTPPRHVSLAVCGRGREPLSKN